jgi:mitochondrial fission protein ELM1
MIWAVIDDRAGNVGQVIGLAEALGRPYQKIEIKYNKFVNLPNIILGASLIGLSNKEVIAPPYPDLVITAGRRSAPIARYIKKQSPTTKLVHIMSPDFGHSDFDLIIMPEHDHVKPAANIISTIGSLHKLTDNTLENERNNWSDKFAHLPKPYIVLLVGGSSKNGKFTTQHAKELGAMANQMAINLGGSLLITSSRRTDEAAKSALQAQLTAPNYFYYFGAEGANPYLGYLALADYIIVTGDSVAMASEACFTGKPTYIYSPKAITGDKHRLYQKQLFTKNLAKPLIDIDSLEPFTPSFRLDETRRVAELVSNMVEKK